MNEYVSNNPPIERLKEALDSCESVIIGAGSGLSTAAGYTYTGERFERYFADFAAKCGFHDMYSGGFYPYDSLEEYWAFWSRHIWINRYAPIPKDTYQILRGLVADKDYFVITTNVDHSFQRTDFNKERLFYTQGDYGLFQCSVPCCKKTWDNYEIVRQMVLSQGFAITENGTLEIPPDAKIATRIPTSLIPHCPHCGAPATTNLRIDGTFVEDEGWHSAANRYNEFLHTHVNAGQRVLFLELGIGLNTPGIIKYPFWQMTAQDPQALYACINRDDTYAPPKIHDRSIRLDTDIDAVLRALAKGPNALN